MVWASASALNPGDMGKKAVDPTMSTARHGSGDFELKGMFLKNVGLITSIRILVI